MSQKIKIMLIEDNTAYRKAIACALKNQEKMELHSQFNTAEVALREIQKNPTHTDLILLDLDLPGMTGIEALSIFQDYKPDIKIIILTQSDRAKDILSCIAAGANGYLLKCASTTKINEAIKTVIRGYASVDPLVAKFMMESLQSRLPKSITTTPLSDRELQVLKLLSEGKTKKEISSELSISAFTVATHVRHIYEKFNVFNAPEAIGKAYRTGILKVNSK